MKNMKFILILVALSVACNKGADPKKEYQDVKTVPGKGASSETLDVAMGPFTFDTIKTADIRYLTFVAGVKGAVVQFQVFPGRTVKDWEVQVVTTPEGSRVTRDKDIITLHWDPDRNESATRVPFQIRAIVKDSAEPRQIGLGAESQIFWVNVDKQNNLPQILEVRGLKAARGQIPTLSFGTETDVTIVGEDPLSTPQTSPELLINGCKSGNNKENPKTYEPTFLKPMVVNPVPGTHKFEYVYKLNLNPKDMQDEPGKDGFELCYELFLLGENNRISGKQPLNIRVMYEPVKPQIIMPTGTRNVLLGKSFDMSVDVVVPGREIGKLEIITTELTPENFPGEATLEDTTSTSRHAGRRNAASKIFHWDVASNPEALGKEYTFKVEAKHTVTRNGKDLPSQTTSSILKFKVTDKNVNGPARSATPPRRAAPPAAPATTQTGEK
jgi:hypothetical protein